MDSEHNKLKNIEYDILNILNTEDYHCIYYILKDNMEEISIVKKPNGIMFDLTKVKPETLEKIIYIINFRKNNKHI